MKHLAQKIQPTRALYLQILFVVLAFSVMAALSYAFMSAIVHGNLVRAADGVLDVAEARVTSQLQEFEAAMEIVAEETRKIVERHGQAEALQAYIDDISQFIFLDGYDISGVQDFYGYFETLPGGPALIHSGRRSWPEEAKPEEFDWYRLAVAAGGAVVETTPSVSDKGGVSYTYAKCLLDDKGRRLGVIAMDVVIIKAGRDVVNTALNQGGYGMLMNQDLVTMFHPNPDFVGISMEDRSIPVYIFVDELRDGKEIAERPMISYKNEESVAFFRKLPNGWYLGLVTPESQYYASMRNMVAILSVLGAILAAVSSVILAHIDRIRVKADMGNKQKSMFLANMSHEIRTPLNAVIGLSELALGNDRLEKDMGDKLEKIHSSGLIILGIVNDILDISKLESGKFEISPTRYDTPSLINDIVAFNSVRVGEKPIELKLDVDENLPGALYGDDLRIKQIFNNLLSNAFKYTDAGTVEWRVSFERDGEAGWLVSSVRDTGIGITPENMQKLFSEYSQVDAKANRKVEGAGLGLAITKRFVEMMDGAITVESEYGRGTTFHVRLRQAVALSTPIGEDTARNLMDMRYTQARRDGNTKVARVNLSYAHVLVVDDVATNIDVARGMMKPYGLKVDSAAGGREAVEMIQAGAPRYSAVFMDHMMPEMDGVEALRIIREEIGTEYAKNIPVIALTANALVGNEEMFLNKGFQDFLSKPIELARLDAVLRRWVRDKEREKELNEAPPAGAAHDIESADVPPESLNINGLDYEKALERFSGDAAAVVVVLRSYAAGTRSLLGGLREQLKAGDLPGYAITVHGIKGSSYGIQAREVGQLAEGLEKAAKAGNLAAVQAGHGPFEKTAEALLDELDRALGEIDAATAAPVAQSPDPELLRELSEACGAFEMDRVDAIMEKLTSRRYEDGEELVAWLREKVADMAFEEIAAMEMPQPRHTVLKH